MSNDSNACVIIAGATGLVGKEVIHQLISQPSIETLYCLSRRTLTDIVDPSNKIIPLLDAELSIHDWDEQQPTPRVGFICLGTTLKQAGSKDGLRKIDVELVCKVAQQMKLIGVKRLAVVSSLGAKVSSSSHYLACKGHMEKTLKGWALKKWYSQGRGLWSGNEKILVRMRKLFKLFLKLFVRLCWENWLILYPFRLKMSPKR